MLGKVYLLGAGPGDPELITVRARRCLADADVVLYDALAHPSLLDFCKADAELVFVGKRAGQASERQVSIHRRMLDAARAGRSVARLKGGNPFLFGRGSEEAEFLSTEGIAFEVVPGVTSAAATAYAGISLTHRELGSSVAFITATESPEKDRSSHDWAKIATATDTLVIFMGLRKLEGLMRLLVENGRDPATPAAVIQNASRPSQRTVVGTVADIAKIATESGIGMPALTVVGPVVGLRNKLRWFDQQPLFGKRVLVTRPTGQVAVLCQMLRDRGADPIVAPTIRIVPAQDPEPLRASLGCLSSYDWVVFTSRNGVEAFFETLGELGGDSRRLGHCKVAAIGPGTRDALAKRGVRPDVVPEEFRGEALAKAIVEHGDGQLAGARILLARAKVAREVLPTMLREAGAEVNVVPAYESAAPEPDAARAIREYIAERAVDVVTFTASSTVTNMVELLGDNATKLLAGVTVASIGPITTQTAIDLGVRVDVTASTYSNVGLVAALTRHYE